MAEIWRTLEDVPAVPSAVAVGVFDGVHAGHRQAVRKMAKAATTHSLRPVVLSFDPDPAHVLGPDHAPPLLMTPRTRATTLIHECGVTGVLLLPFTLDVSRLSPADFVQRVLVDALGAKHVAVGANFRFGHKAAGTPELLQQLGQVHGFTVWIEDLLSAEDAVVSATRIRQAVAEGRVEQASELLGRPFLLEGVVVRGDQVGRELGFPTANLRPDPRLVVPKVGIYAAWAHLDGARVPAAVSIGWRPTFDGKDLRIEAHLLDFDGDLYGTDLALAFTHRLRDEVKFDTVDALVEQIAADVTDTRR
ncbi:MAG: riboflavin kinase/FMN adenylyltransferase, partial [Glaciecola sp.]